MSSAATQIGMYHYHMESPSSARFHPPHIPGRQHWGLSQLNNTGNTFLPWEHSPSTIHPTELLRGDLNEENALSLAFDSKSVDILDTDWISEDITGHVRASLTPGPTRAPTIPHDAGFKAASTNTFTKSTTEHSETKPSMRHIDEKPEGITCTCSKKKKHG
jgi:hypothetical protein